jgi:glucose 1-dehydrogenase
MISLAGQTALVTGASSGIGARIAVALAAAGARVGVNYSRSAEGAQRTVQEITGAGGQAIVLKADVSREDQVLAMPAEDSRQQHRPGRNQDADQRIGLVGP